MHWRISLRSWVVWWVIGGLIILFWHECYMADHPSSIFYLNSTRSRCSAASLYLSERSFTIDDGWLLFWWVADQRITDPGKAIPAVLWFTGIHFFSRWVFGFAAGGALPRSLVECLIEHSFPMRHPSHKDQVQFFTIIYLSILNMGIIDGIVGYLFQSISYILFYGWRGLQKCFSFISAW